MPYKNFGTPSLRPFDGGTPGTAGEYNSTGFWYQYRFNDLYVFGPTMGTGTLGKYLFSPTIFRTPYTLGPGKANYIEFRFQESPLNPLKYNGTTGLSSKGITFYYKVQPESDTLDSPGLAENTSVTPIGIRVISVGSDSGASGSTVGFTLDPPGSAQGTAFCFGFDTGQGAANGITGSYTYYLVNQNSGNENEIVWRMQFNFGTVGSLYSGTGLAVPGTNIDIPMARDTYVISDASTLDPSNTITLISANGTEANYRFVGSTTDNCHITYQQDSTDRITPLTDTRPYQIYPV